ncbi:MAG: DUF2007 domain-containing protein [Chloroflexi bacterium]|nr:DUF2007 domain-containing protein [Chloroflexota bacterium]MCH8065410.1 DUF2007 domain-containing protein [Chloroflexota bacterium]
MRWLRKFFYSDDPVVKVRAALSESEALLLREVLEDSGVPVMSKNMNFLTVTHETGSFGNDYDLFVKQSDLARAEEILGTFDLAEGDEHEDTGGWHSNPET